MKGAGSSHWELACKFKRCGRGVEPRFDAFFLWLSFIAKFSDFIPSAIASNFMLYQVLRVPQFGPILMLILALLIPWA